MKKRALITGITGQDGSYLAELLLSKGYEVHGLVRRTSSLSTSRIEPILKDITLHYGDLIDASSLHAVLKSTCFNEVYNLAAQSDVRISYDIPDYTFETNATGVAKLLEAIRMHDPCTKFYQASTSELYGKVEETPQNELTKFHPRSPYACAKAASYYLTVNYREAFNMYCCSGILFNHESPRRGENFVTRKISRAAARIKFGLDKKLVLGNIDSKRDWGFAGDYVEAMWLMMQQDKPEDYVIATGETHSVREFLDIAFGHVGLDWKQYVEYDQKYIRPAEVDLLLGDATKARDNLGWKCKTSFEDLVKMMVNYDCYKIRL